MSPMSELVSGIPLNIDIAWISIVLLIQPLARIALLGHSGLAESILVLAGGFWGHGRADRVLE